MCSLNRLNLTFVNFIAKNEFDYCNDIMYGAR